MHLDEILHNDEKITVGEYTIQPKCHERKWELGVMESPVRRIIWKGRKKVGVLHKKGDVTYFNLLPGVKLTEREHIMKFLDKTGIEYTF